MSPLRRLWNVVRRARLDDDLRQELDTHLALIEEEERGHGLSAEQARHKARLRFGNSLAYRERAHDAVIATWLEDTGKEVTFAARRLVRSPTFTLAAVLTLALAIGANASIFAVVYRVVVNPLPYGDPDRLLALNNGMPVRNISAFNSLTTQLYYQYLDRARTLDGLAIHRTEEQTLTGQGAPERIAVTRATPSLAPVLRVATAHGRWFTDDEAVPGASPVAVLSHSLWVRRYGQDPGVLGRLVMLDGVPMTVVGVMPSWFAFPDTGVAIWTPLPLTRAAASAAYSFAGVGRLRDGATIDDARTELNRLTADLDGVHPDGGYGFLVSTPTTLIEATVGRVSAALWMLLASVGLVLLVACANVANLFLVRSEARQREVAVRRALGAGHRAIASYFLSESALLSIAGGAVGLALAWGGVRLLVAFGPANLPRLQEVRLDGVAAAFTLALSLVTALAFGSIPLFRFTSLAPSLHASRRGNTPSRGRHRARQLLMGGQIALALVLVVSSGLMLRSFEELRAVNPGFAPTSALTFRLGLPPSDYRERGRIVATHLAILDRLSALPGVTAISASTCLPLAGCVGPGGPLFVEGQILPRGTNPPIVMRRAVVGRFFDVMGMRLVRGRGIEPGDLERNEPIVVVNEALVAVSFPNQDPVGRRIRLGNPSSSPDTTNWLTIAGVVSNSSTMSLAEATPVPQVYMPMFASRDVNLAPRGDAMSYVVRTTLPPLDLVGPARNAIGEIDPQLAVAQVRTLQDIVDGASAQMAFTMVLLIIAAGVALVLGMIGIYGAMSYVVSQRTSEIGVRLALGATPSSVAGMIVRQGGFVALAGITVGLATALAGSRLIESLLYGVSPRDPGVFAATALILLAVALLACWLPARRAARLNPIEALRAD